MCFFNLAEKACKNQPDMSSRGNIHFFGDQILENPESLPLRVSKV